MVFWIASLYIQTFTFQHLNLLYIVQKRSNIFISLVISYVVPCVYILTYTQLYLSLIEFLVID